MGKTFRKYKGKTYKPTTDDQKKKPSKTKHFGYTSGNHTDKHINYSLIEGELVKDIEVRPPIKGKDFIKYGYPHAFYPKHIYKAKKRGEK